MLTHDEYAYYNRQISLDEIGEAGQQKLKTASVLIIGIGGLGCPVSQYLVTAGVGRVCVMDHDVVSISNLHRQILFSYDDIGKSKAVIAKDKLSALNPHVHIDAVTSELNHENCIGIIKGYDLVIDCSDNFYTKYLVNDACVLSRKPWISGSLFKFQGQTSFYNYKGGPTYRCLFPTEGELENCAEAGVTGVLPGIVGTIMAGEAIKFFLDIIPSLSGRLMTIDLLSLQFRFFNFQLHEPNLKIVEVARNNECNLLPIISQEQILNTDLLIDVRSPVEHEAGNIGGINIHVDKMEEHIDEIKLMQKENQRIVLYCKSGVRSKKAATILLNKKLSNVFSISEGIG